jgi:recombination protein RecT
MSGENKPVTIRDLVKTMAPQIGAALPNEMSVDRFLRITLTALRTNPKLGNCTRMSFLAAMINSAQLGLEPNTPMGQAWLIPYQNKGKMECQFQIGYQGLLTLAYRTGLYQRIGAYAVYTNDNFDWWYGLDPGLVHKPGKREGEPTHYYAVYRMKTGEGDFRVWTHDECEAHMKRYSKSWEKKGSAWQTNFPRMAMKTTLIDLMKYAPKSAEIAQAVYSNNRKIEITSEPESAITISPAEFELEEEKAKPDET